MKKLTFLSFLLCVITLTSCTKDGAPVSLILNVDKSSVSYDNNVKPKFSGSSCSYSLWPWTTIGDSSINSAKDDAGITKISSLDRRHFSIFTFSPVGWFVRTCSVVSGE